MQQPVLLKMSGRDPAQSGVKTGNCHAVALGKIGSSPDDLTLGAAFVLPLSPASGTATKLSDILTPELLKSIRRASCSHLIKAFVKNEKDAASQ